MSDKKTVDNQEMLTENANSILLDENVTVFSEELVVESDYVASKPNIHFSKIVGDAVEDIQSLEVSPLIVLLINNRISYNIS